MSIEKAINMVCAQLHHREIVFMLYRAWEVEPIEYHVVVHAVRPFDAMLHFRVVNIWEVQELGEVDLES